MENEGKLEDKIQYSGLLMPLLVIVTLVLILRTAPKL